MSDLLKADSTLAQKRLLLMFTYIKMYIVQNCKALGNFFWLDKGDVKPLLFSHLTLS